jgi:uncharacterized protein (TIGR03086 family)
VAHLGEWVPAFFFATYDLEGELPSPVDDPAAAWHRLDAVLQEALDDPEVAARVRTSQIGERSLADAIDMICTPDVLIHTWDLARATGQDERLDPDAVHRMAEGIEAADEALRASGHYGPRVSVPDDVDEQTWLLAFLGRSP